MNLSAAELAELRADFAAGVYVDTCQFKLKDGSTVAGGPHDCRVGMHRTAGDEATVGGKTTETRLYDLFLRPGVTVQPFWRVEVTFSDGSVIYYTIRDAGSPITNELERQVVMERVR